MPNQEVDERVAQVQVIPFRKNESGWQILLLKRNEAKGGFWQPVTGGINPGEAPLSAAYRELEEELRVKPEACEQLVDDDYTFEFTDQHRGQLRTFTEHVYGIVLDGSAEPTHGEEHVEQRWCSLLGAVSLLKYDSNKTSVQHFWKIVTKE